MCFIPFKTRDKDCKDLQSRLVYECREKNIKDE